jgi:hypothetical protein
MKRWSLVLVVAGLLAMALCGGAVRPAAAYLPLRLQINAKGVVVWCGFDGAHDQIYRWDPKTGAAGPISNPSINNYYPQINAKGQVVWQGSDDGYDQIYRWDPKTQTAVNISKSEF